MEPATNIKIEISAPNFRLLLCVTPLALRSLYLLALTIALFSRISW